MRLGKIMTFKYNPGFSSDDDLIVAFVVREKELQQILQTLQENTGRTYQHLLLVGARGTGKTMLVRRVAAEVRRSEPLNQHWYPLVFGEESYRILSAGEFWLEAIYHLAAQNPGARWQGVYEELRGEKDEKRLQQRAIAKLMDFADEQGKQILLIVENLNMLFDEQMSEGDDWDMRHTLQNEPRLMLLGTATQRFDEIDNVEKAWFEFFALHTIEPLNLSEISQLWRSIADEYLSDNQVRPIQILTGGNPRLLHVLASISKEKSFQETMSNLTQLIDDNTDYFKSMLENLPATERKVLVELLEIWKPASTNQIAIATRLGVNKTSSLLKRLLDRGAVEIVKQSGKKKYYQVAERLFNIYYLMRNRGDANSRVKVVIEFMSMFYTDLHIQINQIILESLELPITQQEEHIRAIYFLSKKIPDFDLKSVDNVLQDSKDLSDEIRGITNYAIESAAAGYTEKTLNTLNELIKNISSQLSATTYFKTLQQANVSFVVDERFLGLEPLMVGLRIFLGEERPLVAQEIFEIGKDVADRIRTRQAELANSPEQPAGDSTPLTPR
jgi:DNA-binding transcriptional regulator GbsR (MarR family)/DNA polymerase III delta prime subunit